MPPNYEYATLQTNRADDIRIYSTHHIKDISRNYGSRFVKSVERGRERKKTELKRCWLIVYLSLHCELTNTPTHCAIDFYTHNRQTSNHHEGINMLNV